MTTTTLSGYVARETEKAIALVRLPLIGEHKPLWIPRKKIASLIERDELSSSVQLAGESVRRLAYPVDLEIDAEWLAKIE
jgi:hypothetical protein